MSKLLYSLEEAAGQLDIGRSRMYDMVARGEIESLKLGRLRRVPHDALVRFVEQLRQEQNGRPAA